jgi:hypothetical protein
MLCAVRTVCTQTPGSHLLYASSTSVCVSLWITLRLRLLWAVGLNPPLVSPFLFCLSGSYGKTLDRSRTSIGPSTSVAPYILPERCDVTTTSILTVGDRVGTYRLVSVAVTLIDCWVPDGSCHLRPALLGLIRASSWRMPGAQTIHQPTGTAQHTVQVCCSFLLAMRP